MQRTKDGQQSDRAGRLNDQPFAFLAWLLWFLALQQFAAVMIQNINIELAQATEFDLNHLTLPGLLAGFVAPALVAALVVLVMSRYSGRH